jgi:hypothetical protein
VRVAPWQEPWQELKPEELGELLDELRGAQDGFPITLAVENPQAPKAKAQARAFLKHLRDEDPLGADDALWVIGKGTYEDVIPEELRKDFVTEDAYLNVQGQEDEERAHVEALVSALTPELVFVAAASAEELKERLEKWQRRVLAVILGALEGFDPNILSELKLGIEAKPDWLRQWAVDQERQHAG